MSPDEIKPGVKRAFELGVHRPEDAAADADAELDAVVEERIDYLVSRGMSRDAARAEARRGLHGGSRNQVRHSAEHRERRMKLQEWIQDLAGDLKYAARTLRRSPALAAAAILTLALPIGANTSIFSAVSAVMLRPLPYAAPDRLVELWEENPDFHWYQQDAAPANMYSWREQGAGVFADVAGFQSFSGSTTLTGYGEPQLLTTLTVTGNFFSVLGVTPFLGRTLREEETWDDQPRAVVLSYGTWRDVFGGDRGLVGKTITLGGRQVQVAGVLPERFALPGQKAQLWIPARWNKSAQQAVWFRRAHFMRVVARLKPGVTLEGANAGLQTIVKRLQQDFPVTNTHMGAGLTPLHEFLVGNTKLPLMVMLGGVGLLLLIACANVGNLLLVRAAGRERETALRLAIGAGRGRLIRQSLAETALLAGLGGGAGVLLGWWGTRALAALQPAGMLPVSDFGVNWTVLGYALAATVLSAAIFGLAPTIWTGRRVPGDVLREEGRTASGGLKSRRWTEGLLVVQVGLALALTLGAGLLVRSYLLLNKVEPGFDASNVLNVTLNLPGLRYDSVPKVIGFFGRLEEEARGLPGVESAALASEVPLDGTSWSSQFAIEGKPTLDRGAEVIHRELTPDYQKVMKVPLRKGRLFTPADRNGSPYVVLINETLATRFFKDMEPVGARISFDWQPDSNSTWRTIVGVVGNERQRTLGKESLPEFIAPYEQEPRSGMTLMLRTRGDPETLIAPVRALVKRMDPLLAIVSVETMSAVRAQSLAQDRFLTVLMLSFAGVGLVLGIVGVYGVMAQLARRRMREMGIRIALGAQAGQVQWLVVRHGLMLTGLGVLAGLGVAVGASKLMRTLLYQVAPLDPVTYVAVPALVLLTALVASWLPASRASRADPCQVLRAD